MAPFQTGAKRELRMPKDYDHYDAEQHGWSVAPKARIEEFLAARCTLYTNV